MYYIKKKYERKYFFDYICGAFVWKSLSRCSGFKTKEDATITLNAIPFEEGVEVVWIAGEIL